MKNYVKEHRGYRVPEGATHWQPEGGEWLDCFIKYEGDESMYINAKGGDSWKPSYGVVSPHIYELPEAKQERNREEALNWVAVNVSYWPTPTGVRPVLHDDLMWSNTPFGMIITNNGSDYRFSITHKDWVAARPVVVPIPPKAEQEWNGKEWDGEGLPPIGAECEISYDGRPWKKCFINYSSKSIVVCTYESGAERAYSTKGTIRFRPVKTQEQKDREAFIDNCLKATAGNEPHKIFHDLYEAGARFK